MNECVQVEWKAPPKDSANGIIKGYKVIFIQF